MKHSIRIKTRQPQISQQVIKMQTRIKNSRNEDLYETLLLEADGVYRLVNGLPKEIRNENGIVISNESDRVAKVTLEMSLTVEQGRKNWYHDFIFYDYESEFPKGVTKVNNEANRILCEFLRKHQQVCVKDKQGNETNKNIIPTLAAYDFIDSTEKIEEEVKRNFFAIEASVKLKEWYEEDKLNPVRLINFAYIWGIDNVSSIPPNVLFNKLVGLASEDMPKFNATMAHIESEITVNILKAIQIKVRGEFIIQQVGSQYVFNNIPIGKDTKEMVMFFSLKENTQQYTLLKNELGVKDIIPQFELPLPPKEPAIDPLVSKPKSKQETDREENNLLLLKAKFTDKIRRVYEKGQDITSEKVGNRYQLLSDTGKPIEQCFVELADDLRIRDNSSMQEWLQLEILAIKKELNK